MSVKIEITIEQLGNGLWQYRMDDWSPGYAETLEEVFAELAAFAPHEARRQRDS